MRTSGAFCFFKQRPRFSCCHHRGSGSGHGKVLLLLTRARARPGFVDGWISNGRRSMTGGPQATSKRSPTVSRLRAMPQAGGIFDHDNLLAGHAGARLALGCNDASGRWSFTCRCDRRVLRTFGRSHDPAEKAHQHEARDNNVVLAFHAVELTEKPENFQLAIVTIRRMPRA